MSPASDPARPRSWLRLQFSLGTLFWLMLVVGIVIAWWKDRSAFNERLAKLEQMVAPTQQSLWGAADILGTPDDPTGGAGSRLRAASISGILDARGLPVPTPVVIL